MRVELTEQRMLRARHLPLRSPARPRFRTRSPDRNRVGTRLRQLRCPVSLSTMSRVFRSTYHDTPDRRLARSGVALRRRLENGASTWEVELPEAPRRVAVAAPGGPVEPPELISDLLKAIVRDR